MGKYCYSRKATAEESCRLTMSDLRKRGLLSGQATEKIAWTSSMTGKTTAVLLEVNITDDPYIRLVYTVTDRD